MAEGLKFEVSIDASEIRARFDAIGSREYRRAIQYALDETAKAAKAAFLPRIPGALSHGPRAGRPSKLTLDPVFYERGRDYDNLGEISSSIIVKPLQSKWLKYLFGDGDNERLPGDVGLAADLAAHPERFQPVLPGRRENPRLRSRDGRPAAGRDDEPETPHDHGRRGEGRPQADTGLR